MTITQKRELALTVHERLDRLYPEKIGFLEAHAQGPYELLIAVILSAQTTDRQVNLISGELFSAYPGPEELSAADQSDVERIIHSTGFYRAKAKNIIGAARGIVEEFGGNVPRTMEELVTLPGVGRKTAGVVLGSVFGQPAIIVDTHFKRVVKRIGLTEETDPVKVEYAIAGLLDEQYQYRFSMTVNNHGREYCHARKPSCADCPITGICLKAGL